MQKVIVFVDDPTVLQSTQDSLAGENLEVVTVDSGESLAAAVDVTSIVLTDIPKSFGLSALQQFVATHSPTFTVPVVVLTSSANEQLAVKAIRDVASSYVPIRLIESELVNTVRNVFAVANAQQSQMRILECVTKWDNEFVLDNDSTLITPLVRYLQESTQRMGILCEPGEETRLGIALEEALLNAIYHGNLEVSSKLREEDDKRFYALVAKRCRQLPFSERRIRVDVSCRREQAVYVITDEGPGFDVKNVPDPTAPENIERVCGRGMLLMRTFMDEVSYNETGNQVTLIKRRQDCDPS